MEKIVFESGKEAYAADAYEPNEALRGNFVGRHQEMKMVTAAWMGGGFLPPMSPLLVGEPGLGKNRLVYELSRQTELPLFIFQGHEDVTAEDFACSVRFSDEKDKGMDYVLSPLVTAMHQGGICFIDEIGKIRPRALALLVSVMDERRYIDSSLLGERVHAQPSFRLIAATNSGEVNALPEFIQSRMRPVIEVGHPPKEEINEILQRHLEDEPEQEKLLSTFWSLWMKSEEDPSPRDALHHFALAMSLCDVEGMERRNRSKRKPKSSPQKLNLQAGRFPMKMKHLKEAYNQLKRKDAA